MSKAFEDWYVQGLQALVAADEAGAKAADDGKEQTREGEVAELAKASVDMQKKHAETIRQLLTDAGGEPSGRRNATMDGIIETANQMMESAADEAKDAAGLAAGQLGFHYYIAAYGSLASTAKHLGKKDDADKIATIVDEVKAQDKRYTDLAERQANEQAADA